MSIEEIWDRGSLIFKHEDRLSIDYVPMYLPHRKRHLEMLARMFIQVVKNPRSFSQRVILGGPVGTGKTAVAKSFGKKVENYSLRRNINIRYAHVNCHKARTLFLIMKTVAKQLNLPIPQRGFSSHELIEIILNMLEDKDQYLILTLDEIDYVIKMGGSDIIYDLTRLSEERLDSNQRISFIFIMRDLTALHLLEESSRSSLLHNIIRFNPYTSEEICDILWYRIEKEEAMYPEAVSDDVIEFIGDLVGVDKGGRGDARLAIETLWRAGKIAEQEGRSKLTIEDVRKAFSTSMITVSIDFTSLDIHALLILLAATKILKNLKTVRYVRVGQVEELYRTLCEAYGIPYRKHTKVWEYVQELSNKGIISTRISGEGQRGKTTFIEIPSLPLKTLERELEKYIELQLLKESRI